MFVWRQTSSVANSGSGWTCVYLIFVRMVAPTCHCFNDRIVLYTLVDNSANQHLQVHHVIQISFMALIFCLEYSITWSKFWRDGIIREGHWPSIITRVSFKTNAHIESTKDRLTICDSYLQGVKLVHAHPSIFEGLAIPLRQTLTHNEQRMTPTPLYYMYYLISNGITNIKWP